MWKANGRTDGRRTLTHDKSSHGLWPGELKSIKKVLWAIYKYKNKTGGTYQKLTELLKPFVTVQNFDNLFTYFIVYVKNIIIILCSNLPTGRPFCTLISSVSKNVSCLSQWLSQAAHRKLESKWPQEHPKKIDIW